MRDWVAAQGWLAVERLPAYAPELNPVEMLRASLKTRELANFAGDHLSEIADATETGINRVCDAEQLPGPSAPTPGWKSTTKPHPANKKISRR